MFKTKTKTFIFVLDAPRGQDPGLEDYITACGLSAGSSERGMIQVGSIHYGPPTHLQSLFSLARAIGLNPDQLP